MLLHYLAKAGSFIWVLLCMLWMALNFGWDSVLGFVAGLGAYIYLEVQEFLRARTAKENNRKALEKLNTQITDLRTEIANKPTGHDIKLFKEFRKQYPSNGSLCDFLNNHNFGYSFDYQHLIELEKLIEDWSVACRHFNNNELDLLRKQFIGACKILYDELLGNTDKSGSHSVSIGMSDMEFKKEKFELQSRLNELSTKVYDVHQALIKKGQKILD